MSSYRYITSQSSRVNRISSYRLCSGLTVDSVKDYIYIYIYIYIVML